MDNWRRDQPSERNERASSIEAGVALLGIGRELIRVRDDGSNAPEKRQMAREVARFLAKETLSQLDSARRAARRAAFTRLHELRGEKHGSRGARAAGLEMIAFAAIEAELDRCRVLVRSNSARRTSHAP